MVRPPHSFVIALLVAGVSLALLHDRAFALPPAGTATMDVTGQVSITSRTGQETISLVGTATIDNDGPHTEGSIEVDNAVITALTLTGNSVTGPVTVLKSASPASNGEVRSVSGSSFPATSFFNVYATVTVPASPNPSITLHNDVALVASSATINGWPPYQAVYAAAPNPCIMLQPAIQNPAQICITAASFTLTTPGVGGIAMLSEASDDGQRVKETTFNDHAVGILVVLGLLATFGVVANFARSRLHSEG